MQMLRVIAFGFAASLLCTEASYLRQQMTGPTTGMAGLEGEACGTEEWTRYKTIVCSVVKECDCAPHKCDLEWCHDYVHTWKKEFGACVLKGCGEKPKEF